MKKLSLLLAFLAAPMFGLPLCALGQSNIITIPFGTTQPTNTPAWLDPNYSNAPAWNMSQAWQAANTNFGTLKRQGDTNAVAILSLQAQWGTMTDADTNSIVASPIASVFSTNWVDLSVTNLVILGTWTNFASATYAPNGTMYSPLTIPNGPDCMVTFNGGTNWTSAIGLAPKLGLFTVEAIQPSGTLPLTPGISNITISIMTRPDKFGAVQDTSGQIIKGDPATDPRQFVNLAQMQAACAVLPSLTGPLWMNGNAINYSSTWSTTTTTTDSTIWSYLGAQMFSCSAQPPLYVGTNYVLRLSIVNTTNVTLSIPTNAVTSMPVAQVTSDFKTWKYLSQYVTLSNTYPAAVGTNYQISFVRSGTLLSNAFLRVCYAGTSPGVFSLSALLQGTTRTVTNSTDSTFGYGAGLICADTNYIYVSWTTNGWKRVALSTW